MVVVCVALGSNAAHGQNPPRVPLLPAPGFGAPGQVAEAPKLPRFDLEFRGGSPADLVKELSKAQGAPVNAVIPSRFEDIQIPKLQLANVTVSEVFDALARASQRAVKIPTDQSAYGRGSVLYNYTQEQVGFGFRAALPISTNSIWTFFSSSPEDLLALPVLNQGLKVFSLARYLGKPEQGLHSVEDIITAVQTGWKMQKISPLPELTYHPETKLLMAYGQEAHLTLITDVLKQLEPLVLVPGQKEKVNPEVMKILEKGGLVVPQEPSKSK